MDINQLYDKFRDEFQIYVKRVEKDGEKATPYIISRTTLVIVPRMMIEVGKIKSLSGIQKKQLIIDTTIYAIEETFKTLNNKTNLKTETWDEDIRDLLLALLPMTIDLAIEIDKGHLKFNTSSNWFDKCRCGKIES